MAVLYVKLATATLMVEAGEITQAELLAAVEAGETIVVNLKGRMLTSAQVENHLEGRVDGETVVRP